MALAGKYFNVIALAVLTTKLTIVDSMLMQRAATTFVSQDEGFNVTNLYMMANTTMPDTGTVGSVTGSPELMLPEFNNIMFTWNQKGGLIPWYGGNCTGYCYMAVPAIGFEFDCTEPVTTDVNYGNETYTALMYEQSHNGSYANGTYDPAPTVFDLSFGAGQSSDQSYTYLTMNILTTNATDSSNSSVGDCPGTVWTETCKLRPAVIEYPVLVQTSDPTSTTSSAIFDGAFQYGTISFETNPFYSTDYDQTGYYGEFNLTTKQINGFKVLEYINLNTTADGNGEGGTVRAL